MLKNISVRNFILIFLFASLCIANIISVFITSQLLLIILFNFFWLSSLIILWFYMTNYLVKPINSVMNSIDKINKGDLSISIPIFGNNCAGKLIPGINQLANNISLLVDEIRTSSHGAFILSEQLGNHGNDLSQKTEQQSTMLMQTAASMEEIAAGTKNNAENTHLATEKAEQANKNADKGNALMEDVARKMAAIATSAKKMTEIISLIDEVAFQTNMLALNAAVEAAHAGEHGKGFSVVSDEVRKLAQRSADAAKNIKVLIKVTIDNVAQGAQIVSETEENMKKIVSGASIVNELMTQISVSTQQQEKGIEQITIALAEIEKVTQESVVVADKLTESSLGLKKQVSELESRTADFHLQKEINTQSNETHFLDLKNRFAEQF